MDSGVSSNSVHARSMLMGGIDGRDTGGATLAVVVVVAVVVTVDDDDELMFGKKKLKKYI
jgi:hypothetical protein